MIEMINSMRNFREYLKCLVWAMIFSFLFLSACTPAFKFDSYSDFPAQTKDVQIPSSTHTPTAIPQPIKITPSPTPTEVIISISGNNVLCLQPSENYDRLEMNGHIINQRTYEMLAYAQTLYDGEIDLTGDAITQGSYTNAVEASFGTHAGGGAVDISVMAQGTYVILYGEIPNLIHALRVAGFAAWYRDFNELYEVSPPHIHAIAIGDRELSITAREQLAGPFGYFWGYNGLPTEDKLPIRDPHGGPIVCDWMIEKGYPNKTATPGAEESLP